MSPPVKPEQDPGHILTGAEWAAAQYAPQRFDQDPKAQTPMGRVLTGAEWDQMQRSSNPSKLTFPALPTPKFVADQTKRLNPNSGKPDQSILEQIDARVSPYTEAAGAGIRKAAEGFDTAAQMLGPMGGAASVVGPALRQVAAPIVEHPFSTGALIAASKASPVVTGGLITADMLMNLGKYGYQTVHEAMMTPEERAIAQRDPNRISGEAALFQAFFVGLGGLGIASHINQELGFTKTLGEADPALHSFVQSTAGAQALGTGAAEHGLPATASPYPPESPLSAAWRDGYSSKPRVRVPGTVEYPPPPEHRVVPPKIGVPEPGGPSRVYHGTKEAFSEFDASKSDPNALYGPGFYFTENPTKASGYAETKGGGEAPHVKVAGLDIKRPFNINYDAELDSPEVQHILATAEQVMPEVDWAYGRELLDEREQSHNLIGADIYKVLSKMVNAEGIEAKRAGANQILKAAGYDGITHIGGKGPKDSHRVWIAFDKEQIGPPKKPATLEPVPPTAPVAPTAPPVAEPTVPPAAPPEPVGATSGLTPIEGTGETRTRGLATSTVSRVAEDIKSLWSDLPEYQRISISEQAHRAQDLITQDPVRAKSIAMGDEPAPIGLHAEAVFVALRNKARAEGDVGLIHDLATGGLTEQATTMGQKLRLLAENDPEDPVAKIRRISDKRSEGRGAAKAIKSETEVIAKHTELNLKSLMDFFESQKC